MAHAADEALEIERFQDDGGVAADEEALGAERDRRKRAADRRLDDDRASAMEGRE